MPDDPGSTPQTAITPNKGDISIGSYGAAGHILYRGSAQEGQYVHFGENVFSIRSGDWGKELFDPGGGRVQAHTPLNYNSGGYSGYASTSSTTNINSIYGNTVPGGQAAYISTSTGANRGTAATLGSAALPVMPNQTSIIILGAQNSPTNAKEFFGMAKQPYLQVYQQEAPKLVKSDFSYDAWVRGLPEAQRGKYGGQSLPEGFAPSLAPGIYGQMAVGNNAAEIFRSQVVKPGGQSWNNLATSPQIVSVREKPGWLNRFFENVGTGIDTANLNFKKTSIGEAYGLYMGTIQKGYEEAGGFFENLAPKPKTQNYFYNQRTGTLLSPQDYALAKDTTGFREITLTDRKGVIKAFTAPPAATFGLMAGIEREAGQNPVGLGTTAASGALFRSVMESGNLFFKAGVRTSESPYFRSMFAGLEKGTDTAQYVLGGVFIVESGKKASLEASQSDKPITSYFESIGGSLTQAAAFGGGDLAVKGRTTQAAFKIYEYGYREKLLGRDWSYVPLTDLAEPKVISGEERFSTIPLRDLEANRLRFEAATFFRNKYPSVTKSVSIGNALDRVGTLEVPKNPDVTVKTPISDTTTEFTLGRFTQKYYPVTHATTTGMDFPSVGKIIRGESQQGGLYVSSRQYTQLYFLMQQGYEFKFGTAKGGVPSIIETSNLKGYSEELIPLFEKEGRYNTRLSDEALRQLGKTTKGSQKVYLETRTFYGDTPEVQGVLAEGSKFRQMNLREYPARAFGFTKYTTLPNGDIVPIRNFSVFKGGEGLSKPEFTDVVRESESSAAYKRTFSAAETALASSSSRSGNAFGFFGTPSYSSKRSSGGSLFYGYYGKSSSGSSLAPRYSFSTSGSSLSSSSSSAASSSGSSIGYSETGSSGSSSGSSSSSSIGSSSGSGRSGFGSSTIFFPPYTPPNQYERRQKKKNWLKEVFPSKSYKLRLQFGSPNFFISNTASPSATSTTPRRNEALVKEFKYSRRIGTDYFKTSEERRKPSLGKKFGFRL